jgi:hypothetical protein
MRTPTPREVMGMTGRLEQAKVGGPTLARPAETYRAARRAFAKTLYRLQKKQPT